MQGSATASTVPADSRVEQGPIEPPGPQPAGVGSAVTLKGVGKNFDDTWVVRDLDLVVQRGTIFGLFGPSGSGKTTTIRLMLGLLAPDVGEITVLGIPPRRFNARRRAEIGYMPQLFVLFPELSVDENLDLVASLYGLGWLGRRKRKREALEFVELWDDRRKLASQLSGGMKRRLELACALMHAPELLVVDEPTAGVDPILRAKFWDHFRALRDAGQTIFVTSQYVTEAEYCDEIAVLGPGQLVAQGTPEQVREAAMGGEIVEVMADGMGRSLVERLRVLEGVRSVRPLAYDQLRLIVDQAGVRIPEVLELLREADVEVRQVQEYRPNFDEVFVMLMEQHQDSEERSDAL
jgi:ABC-2 type transport system ATP-binding protein